MAADLDLPHPRERALLVGQDAAEAEIARALAGGRTHHAWLIGGPPGIGKATLAYRMARALLAPAAERGPGLAVAPGTRTFRQVAARAHPNLLVLERQTGEGDKAAPRTISVDAARRAPAFFATTAADGGHRVCIVDAIEELTIQGVNALLKTIEEPPADATILIVSHAPHRVLPTIRSRCRKLLLKPLEEPDLARILGSLDLEADAEALARAASLAEGSVRRALALLDRRRQQLVEEVEGLLGLLPRQPQARIMALAERLADRKAEEEFEIALDTVQRWASRRIRAGQAEGPRRLAPLAEVCDKLGQTARAVETYNLDRKPFVLSLFGDLAEAVRSPGRDGLATAEER